jgi:hypothetical protein
MKTATSFTSKNWHPTFTAPEKSSIIINCDTLLVSGYRPKLASASHTQDSILSIKLNTSLKLFSKIAAPAPPDHFSNLMPLKSGEKVAFIDSGYETGADRSYIHKIALLDKAGNRKWTVDAPKKLTRFIDAIELQDGTFLVEMSKHFADTPYDTTSIVHFDLAGKEKEIRHFLDPKNTNDYKEILSEFIEAKENEIWIFYKRDYLSRQTRVYFEKKIIHRD